MGIVNKPFDFDPTEVGLDIIASKVDSNFDTVYAVVNGDLEDANISALANIAQSKIANLVSDLANRTARIGDTMTGPLTLKFTLPFLRLIGTEAAGSDWRMVESGGVVHLQRNEGGTELAPAWVTWALIIPVSAAPIYDPGHPQGLVTRGYVDFWTRSLFFGEVVKSNGDFSTASTTFVDVPDLSINLVPIANGQKRVRVSFVGVASVAETPPAIEGVGINCTLNGVPLFNPLGTVWLYRQSSVVGVGWFNLSFSVVTPVLTPGINNTFKIQLRSLTGATVTLKADSTQSAIFQVEELSR